MIDYGDFSTLSIKVSERVAWLTIDHPPINLFDMALISDMAEAGTKLAEDDGVGAVVLQSADPDFFIAHADVTLIQTITGSDPDEDPPSSFFHAMTEQFRLMPKPTIGKIAGIARGGGLELLAALDMRFCSLEKTTLAQPEVTVGIIPGGGGSTRWPRLIGHGKAMELMIGGSDIDGATAERYGMVNRAMPLGELDAFVDNFAKRVASFPPHAVALIKKVSLHQDRLQEALDFEHHAFMESARHPDAIAAMQTFMDNGGQNRDAELTGAFS